VLQKPPHTIVLKVLEFIGPYKYFATAIAITSVTFYFTARSRFTVLSCAIQYNIRILLYLEKAKKPLVKIVTNLPKVRAKCVQILSN
jgi:hypothetical protein